MNRTPSHIEFTIMAYKKMTADGSMHTDDTPLLDEVSLKRKADTLNKLNYACPSPNALNMLIASCVTSLKNKENFRWLEVERKAVPFELISVLKPLIVVDVDQDRPSLVHNNFRYSLSKLTASTQHPDVRFVENDLSTRCQLLKLFNVTSKRNQCKAERFDLISCVFSLPRFFASEESAQQLFTNLASYLVEEDGRLICVFRSGSDLLPPTYKCNKKQRTTTKKSFYNEADEDEYAYREKHSTEQILKGLLKTLEKSNDSKKTTYDRFGSLLPVEQQHTVVAHQSSEYLVFRNVVLSIAANVGLTPINECPKEMLDHYEEADINESFKHFKGTCYVSVIFKKNKL